VQKVLNRADDSSFIARCTSFHGEQSDTAQPPFGWAVFLEQIVIIDSLMGAMKSANSDVGDPLADPVTIIGRNANARR
jgi:hypothetical protein